MPKLGFPPEAWVEDTVPCPCLGAGDPVQPSSWRLIQLCAPSRPSGRGLCVIWHLCVVVDGGVTEQGALSGPARGC